jgi:hypothetical protein
MATQDTPAAGGGSSYRLITCYSYTGAPDAIPLDDRFAWQADMSPVQHGLLDAPSFIPLGYNFGVNNDSVANAYMIRPGSFKAEEIGDAA